MNSNLMKGMILHLNHSIKRDLITILIDKERYFNIDTVQLMCLPKRARISVHMYLVRVILISWSAS
jgi:hypothetical protein